MSMLMDVFFGTSLALNETKGPLQETLPSLLVDTSHCHTLDIPVVTFPHVLCIFAIIYFYLLPRWTIFSPLRQ